MLLEEETLRPPAAISAPADAGDIAGASDPAEPVG